MRTLVIQLFPKHDDVVAAEKFGQLLRASRLIFDDEENASKNDRLEVLPASERARMPAYAHARLRDWTQEWSDQISLFLFCSSGEDPIRALSKLETLNNFVPALRSAQKVLFVHEREWEAFGSRFGEDVSASSFRCSYRWSNFSSCTTQDEDLIAIRLGAEYGLPEVQLLSSFLGTRGRTRRDSADGLPASVSPPIGVSSRTSREDESTQELVLPQTPQEPAELSDFLEELEIKPPSPSREEPSPPKR